ncbi:MAG: tetratricopeptide repeat protein, partial [Bryobacteraceae bacterium]
DGDTSDPCYLFNLGYVLWKQEDFEEAADEFRAVLEEDPDDAEAKTMLTRCEKKEGPRPAETRMELRERLKENFDELVWPQVNVGRPAVEAEPAVK